MPNPYAGLPPSAFWRTAIANKTALEICELWKPKHPFKRSQKVATFGSCFAKQLRHALKARGFAWFDAEPPPDFFPPAIREKYNYHVFSARTGNIYTAAALRQWVSWAIGVTKPSAEIWEAKGRFFDPFRPSIEPGGFASQEELLASRDLVLRAIRNVVLSADWFVFTLGSIEGWVSASEGDNYAVAPGTTAGEFDSKKHSFKTYSFAEISADLGWVIETISKRNAGIRFLLSVSAVPLNETATGKHVLTATIHSQAILRAIAGTLAESLEIVDYFPSYEIIATPPFKGMFYESSQRSVSSVGVMFVMDSFFARLGQPSGGALASIKPAAVSDANPRAFWSNVIATRKALRGLL